MKKLISYIICFVFMFSVTAAAGEEHIPSGTQIQNALEQTSPLTLHPRLIARDEDIERIIAQKASDPVPASMYDTAVNSAGVYYLDEYVPFYDPQTSPNFKSGRDMVHAVIELGCTYFFTGDTLYADKIVEIMEGISSYPRWNGAQELDLGSTATAMALGYDWIYSYLTEEQREKYSSDLYNKAVLYGLDEFENNTYGWQYSLTNWNSVINSGVLLSALAVYDIPEYTRNSIKCIRGSLISLDRLLAHFDPDGIWDEGYTYWEFTIEYLIYALSALESACGTDFGMFTRYEGFCQTPYFPIYLKGAGLMCNYGDSESKARTPRYENIYFAKMLKDPDIAAIRYSYAAPRKNWACLEIFWYDPSLYKTVFDKSTDADKLLQGSSIKLGMLRSGYSDEDLIAWLRGGDVSANHGHHDTGGFIFDALGVRWALDLGGEYYYDDYFKAQRFDYYRTRPEGHNLFVANPSYSDNVNKQAAADIQLTAGKRTSYAVTDLSQAYTNLSSAKRGIALIRNKTSLLIRDELRLEQRGDIYWFMHTDADITLNGNTARLYKGGKYLTARILSPAGAGFEVRDAVPFDTSPQKVQNGNEGIKKLTVHLEDTMSENISVLLTPETDEALSYPVPEVPDLQNWDMLDSDMAAINRITVNGMEIIPDPYLKDHYIGTDTQSKLKISVDANCPWSYKRTVGYPVTVNISAVKDTYNRQDVDLHIYPGFKEIVNLCGDAGGRLTDGDIATGLTVEPLHDIIYMPDGETDISGISLYSASGLSGINVHYSYDGEKWYLIRGGAIRTAGWTDLPKEAKKVRYIKLSASGINVNVGEMKVY